MSEDDRPTTALERQLQEERRRSDYLIGQIGGALTRMDMRLHAIEARLKSRMTPQQWAKVLIQWAKILTGIGLPLGALWLTGSMEAALKFVVP